MSRITLAEAVARFGAEAEPHAGRYERFRAQAAERGWVWMGDSKVPVVKVGRQWMVDEELVTRAVAARRAERTAEALAVSAATEDYEARKLHPGGARTSWGGYRVQGDFHFAWSDHDVRRMHSDGGWRCNACWSVASTEHDRPECHTCSDWNGCGTDCTLSRVLCKGCGASLSLWAPPAQ